MSRPQSNRISPDPRTDLPRPPVDRYSKVDDRTSLKKKRLPLYIGSVLLIILILIAAAASLSKQVRHQLELSIVRQPTPYTQLYFSHLAALPGKLKVDQKNTFDFTIVNDENRSYHYTYAISLDDPKTQVVISRGAVTIDNGSSATRAVTIVPKDRKARYLITIALEGVNQSIHFYGQTS